MTLTHRRILYIAFFIIFFIAAPIVILWAEGYKMNPVTNKLEKTGVLFLESEPEDAEIYLNGKLTKYKTTARIKGLLPGEYQVEVKKDGFLSWSKKMTIYPSVTSFAQYIRLFKKDLPTVNVLNKEIIVFSEIKNNKIAFAAKQNSGFQIYILDLENNQIKEIFNISLQPQEIILNKSAETMLIKTTNDWMFFDSLNKKTARLNDFVKLNLKNPRFDDFNPNIFYAISRLGIEKIDTSIPKRQRIVTGSIIDFYLKNNNFYYLRSADNQLKLINSSLANLEKTKILAQLPFSSDYHFYESADDLVNIIDEQNKILYLFDFNKKLFEEEKLILADVQFLSWHEKFKSLLFSNDHEIWTYIKKDSVYEKNIITRLSKKIIDTFWFSYDTHILYLTEKGLEITEIINHNKFLTSFEKLKGAKKAFLNIEGNLLYWQAENGFLYRSELQ